MKTAGERSLRVGYRAISVGLPRPRATTYAIPDHLKIWDTTARSKTLRVSLWGALIVLSLGLAHTSYGYWVFRGKTGEEEGYGG